MAVRKSLTVNNKTYDIAPITFSRQSIELLEMIDDLEGDQKKVLKAIRLVYDIIIDCLVRGGSVKNKKEAEDVLSNVEFKMETIQEFISLMVSLENEE